MWESDKVSQTLYKTNDFEINKNRISLNNCSSLVSNQRNEHKLIADRIQHVMNVWQKVVKQITEENFKTMKTQ